MEKGLQAVNLGEVMAQCLVLGDDPSQNNLNFVPSPDYVKIDINIPPYIKNLILLASNIERALNQGKDTLIINNTYCIKSLNINHQNFVRTVVGTALKLMFQGHLKLHNIHPSLANKLAKAKTVTFGLDKDWNMYVKVGEVNAVQTFEMLMSVTKH